MSLLRLVDDEMLFVLLVLVDVFGLNWTFGSDAALFSVATDCVVAIII